jgi:hypothetical protein
MPIFHDAWNLQPLESHFRLLVVIRDSRPTIPVGTATGRRDSVIEAIVTAPRKQSSDCIQSFPSCPLKRDSLQTVGKSIGKPTYLTIPQYIHLQPMDGYALGHDDTIVPNTLESAKNAVCTFMKLLYNDVWWLLIVFM